MMIRLMSALAVTTAVLGAGGGGTSAERQSAEICHIANAGFALRGPSGTVLIDALFRTGLPDYQRASAGLNERMETGAAPFGDVRFVIASHVHDDHFSAAALVRHAEHNPGTRYIVTPQALARMRSAGLSETAANRVKAVHPANDEKVNLEYDDVGITVFRISHGKGSAVENIGTLVRMDGLTFFHTGDMEPYAEELAEAGLTNLGVDVAMVPFWVLMNDENRTLVRDAFSAKRVIPMHVPDQEQSWMAEYGGLAGIRKLIESNVPNTVWDTGEMACRPARANTDENG